MTAIDLLCEIIVQGTKVPAATHKQRPEYRYLVEHGFLTESGVVSSVACYECDTPHSAEVIFQNGQYGFHCPDLGLRPLSRDDISAVAPDLPKLIDCLAKAFNCRQRKKTAIRGQTWRIGSVKTTSEPVMLYFHPGLQSEQDAHDLQIAMNQEARSRWRLVVTTQGGFPLSGISCVNLGDLVELDNEFGGLRALAKPADLVGMPRQNKGGAPNRFDGFLSALYEHRKAIGASLDGRNEEAKALLADFEMKYPDRTAPSLSTVKTFVSNSRAGQ